MQEALDQGRLILAFRRAHEWAALCEQAGPDGAAHCMGQCHAGHGGIHLVQEAAFHARRIEPQAARHLEEEHAQGWHDEDRRRELKIARGEQQAQ